MQVDLQSRWRRVLLSCVLLACTGAYVFKALRSYVAYRASRVVTVESLRRAVRLEPGNSDYHHQLGLLYLFVDQDVNAAVEHYRAAVAVNPHVAKYWLDLAEAYNTAGDSQAQTAALKHAIESEPTRPAIAWEAANLYLVQENVPEALRLFRLVLGNDPQGYTLRALDTSWRATHDPNLIMHDVLPADPIMYTALLQMMINQNRPEDAASVWKGLTSLGKPFDPKLAFPYFDYEINNRRPESAAQIWEFLLRMNPELADDHAGSFVFNGGFDRDLLNGGFDWHFMAAPHVKADLDTTEVHGGNRSLLLTYDGEPSSDAGVYQFVLTQPNTTYEFSAFEKAYELLTPSGPRFRVSDAYTGTTLLETPDVLGTSVWSQLSGRFNTGPETRVLKIAIIRNPAFQRISGKFWVDDVSLRRQ